MPGGGAGLQLLPVAVNAEQREGRAGHPGPRLDRPGGPLGAHGAHDRPHGGRRRGQADGSRADQAHRQHPPQARPRHAHPHEEREAQVVADRPPSRARGQPVADDGHEPPELAGQGGQGQDRGPADRDASGRDAAPGGPALADPLLAPLRHGADQGPQRRGEHVRVVGHPRQDAARRPPARVRPHHPGGRERVGQVDRPGGERQGGDDDAPREGPARAEQLGAQDVDDPDGPPPGRARRPRLGGGPGFARLDGAGAGGSGGPIPAGAGGGAHRAPAPRPVTRSR